MKIGLRLPGARWVKPYVAGRYAWNVGFDTFVTRSYDGPSAALGVELER